MGRRFIISPDNLLFHRREIIILREDLLFRGREIIISREDLLFRRREILPGISVAAPIRRSTPWAFIRKTFPFVPAIEMSTLFSFSSKNQINAQGAATENPGIISREGTCYFARGI